MTANLKPCIVVLDSQRIEIAFLPRKTLLLHVPCLRLVFSVGRTKMLATTTITMDWLMLVPNESPNDGYQNRQK